MRKRHKKKREIKEEIRHARIMRSFEIAQKIIHNAVMISHIGRMQLFQQGGVVVGVNQIYNTHNKEKTCK